MTTPENSSAENSNVLVLAPAFLRGLTATALRGVVVVASFAVLKEAEVFQHMHPATMGARGNPTRWEQ
jgi:hypothetical protein